MISYVTLIHRNSKVFLCVKLNQWCDSCKLCRDQSWRCTCQLGRWVWNGKDLPPAALNHNEDVMRTLGDIMEIELLKQPWGCHGEHALGTQCCYLQAGLRDLALILSHIQIHTHMGFLPLSLFLMRVFLLGKGLYFLFMRLGAPQTPG